MSSADDVPESDGDPTPVASFAVQPDIAALYKRHREAMRDSACRVFGPRAVDSDVDEAVSAVISALVVAHSKGTLCEKENWEPYLRKSVQHAAVRIAKDRLTNDPLDPGTEDGERIEKFDPRTHAADPVADEVIKRAEWQAARDAIARAGLTNHEREILNVFLRTGMTDKLVGELYGVSGQAIGKTRRAAQRKLGRHLEGGDTT